MRRSFLALATLLVAVLAGTLLTAPPTVAADKHPVPYNFLPWAVAGGAQSNAVGTNIWTCKPSAAHPRPVVLVHGLMGNRSTNWPTYGPLLANEGYCVFALTYGVPAGYPPVFGGLNDMRHSARQLRTFVDEVLAATGAEEVDIVGHSEGTLMPNWYVKYLGGAEKVRRYVSIAPVWRGTQAASPATIAARVSGADPGAVAPVCVSCGQFSPDSQFMRQIRKGGIADPGVEYTNIVTMYDELVIPYTSGIVKGMRNHVIQHTCATNLSEHFQIVSDRQTSVLVLNALDPANRRTVPCEVVLPFVGGRP